MCSVHVMHVTRLMYIVLGLVKGGQCIEYTDEEHFIAVCFVQWIVILQHCCQLGHCCKLQLYCIPGHSFTENRGFLLLHVFNKYNREKSYSTTSFVYRIICIPNTANHAAILTLWDQALKSASFC